MASPQNVEPRPVSRAHCCRARLLLVLSWGLSLTAFPLLAVSLGETYGRLPLAFEANAGQAEAPARFLARGPGYCVSLRSAEAVLVLRRPNAGNAMRLGRNRAACEAGVTRLRLQLLGAAAEPDVAGVAELPGRVNYLVGRDPSLWRRDVPAYARVNFREVYPGIDLVYYGNHGQLEYDFIVAPGADPGTIALGFEGAEKLEVDERGDLVLTVDNTEVRFHRPMLYQETDGVRTEVSGGYVLCAGTVGFEVGPYDSTRPLVIDPVLSFSTYLGGTGVDKGWDVAVDASGNAYVAGETESGGLATTNAFQRSYGGGLGGGDAFVAKLNSNGTALVYLTYLGGNDADGAWSLALDAAGNAYVAGFTYSTDFPTTNAAQPAIRGTPEPFFGLYPAEAFVAKLNTNGSALLYSTYLGGGDVDLAIGIAVDAAGNAYVAGLTTSGDFPTTTNALQKTLRLPANAVPPFPSDAFVAKLDTTQAGANSLVYSTYLGGDAQDHGESIAVDGSGHAYVAGQTASVNFPTTNAFQQFSAGFSFDVFVARLDPTGSALEYSTYLGGAGLNDFAGRIAVDSAGRAYVAGSKNSSNFPITPGAINRGGVFKSSDGGGTWNAASAGLTHNRINDLRLSPAGPSLLFAATSRAVFSSADSGGTWMSLGANFPVTAVAAVAADPAVATTLYAATDSGVIKSTNSGVFWNTWSAGLGNPVVNDLAVDATAPGRIYAATAGGIFRSTNAAATWEGINSGLGNGFVNDLAMASAVPAVLYAATAGGVFKSINGGDSWAGANVGLANLSVNRVAIDPTATAVAYAATDGGVFKSTDGGANWTNINTGLSNLVVKALAMDPTATTTLYAGTEGGVFKSVDGGANWTAATNGLADLRVNSLAVDPANPATIYAGTRGDAAYGIADAFVTRLNAQGTGLDYSVAFGGSASSRVWDIALDGAGDVFVAGETTSPNFPVVSALQTNLAGSSDAFVARLNADASQFVYSTYLGGAAGDFGYGIAVDSVGNAYVTGSTFSSGFPTRTNAVQLAAAGGGDAFVAKIALDGAPPSLAISRAGNLVTLSWPAPSDFVLESTASLGASAVWMTVATLPTVANAQNTVSLDASSGTLFFRLRR